MTDCIDKRFNFPNICMRPSYVHVYAQSYFLSIYVQLASGASGLDFDIKIS